MGITTFQSCHHVFSVHDPKKRLIIGNRETQSHTTRSLCNHGNPYRVKTVIIFNYPISSPGFPRTLTGFLYAACMYSTSFPIRIPTIPLNSHTVCTCPVCTPCLLCASLRNVPRCQTLQTGRCRSLPIIYLPNPTLRSKDKCKTPHRPVCTSSLQ